MRLAVKLVVLLLLVPLAFAVYAYASLYFAGYLFPRVLPRPYLEMVSAALVGSLAAGLMASFPLARMFSQRYWLAALVVASPFMAVRTSDLMHYAGRNEPRIMVMSIVELLVYPSAIIACAWLVSRRLEASKASSSRAAPGAENAA
jgi:hypothetical protein